MVACLFGCSFGCHVGDRSDVALAFEDIQVIQLFSSFGILLGYFWYTFGIPLGYFWDTFEILSGYFWDTFGILLGYQSCRQLLNFGRSPEFGSFQKIAQKIAQNFCAILKLTLWPSSQSWNWVKTSNGEVEN